MRKEPDSETKMMQRAIVLTSAVVCAVLFGVIPVLAISISQIEFDLQLPAGSAASYSFQVMNEESRKQEIKVYLGDWVRSKTGDTEFLPLNGARWLFLREFQKGEELEILYRVRLSTSDVTVSGSYISGSPSARGEIVGETQLGPSRVGQTSPPNTDEVIRIAREIVAASPEGDSVTVRLGIRILEDVAGLRIDEVFSSHVNIEALDSAGGAFDAAARSNSDWLEVSPQSFQLDAGEAQEVTFSIQVPPDAEGTYWGVIFIEGSPRPEQTEGATVLAIERFGVKIYETVPGTEVLSGEIKQVRKIGNDPLSFEILFENTGNVQLRPSGRVDIAGRTGDLVKALPVEKFYVLPGASRQVEVIDQGDSLSPGRYLALAVLDIGNPEYLLAGQLVFEVQEVLLVPIGESANLPKDLDGDGLYEDINGDGQLTVDDLALFGFQIDSEAVQENAEAFDFDNDGEVTFNDVVALKAMLEGQ